MSLEDNKPVPFSPQSDVSTAHSLTSHQTVSANPKPTLNVQTQPAKSTLPKTNSTEPASTKDKKSTQPKTQSSEPESTKSKFETDDLIPMTDSEVEV